MPMGQYTTTFNIDELITSYIDDEIPDPELRSQIEEMLGKDAALNAKYQSELLTRNMMRERMPEAELPIKTYQSVITSIDSVIAAANLKKNAGTISQQAFVQYPSFWQSIKNTLTGRFIGVPRYAFAILAFFIIGSLFVFGGGKKVKNPYILAGTEKSIMIQAVNSFHKIIDGEIGPRLKSSNAAEVEKYVQQTAHFNAYVPKIDNYELKGVECSQYNGQELAHIIYENGDKQMIYILQTPVTGVEKKNFDLPGDVHNEMVNAKFYMCDQVDETDCTMTLWYRGNVICVSMTTLPKQDMYATFSRFNK
jgi:hypothetical protein